MPIMERIQSAIERGQALDAVELALEHAERDENVRFLLPALYLNLRDSRQSLDWIRRLAGQLDGEWNVLPLCRLASLARQTGAVGLARRCLDKAVQLGPGRWTPLWERYRLSRDSGALKSARRQLRALIRLQGSRPRLLHEEAYLAGESGALDKALDAYGRARDAFSYHQRAEIFRRLGDPAAARREEAEVLKLDPGYLWTRWRRAEDRAAAGDFGHARRELEQVRSESQPLLSPLRAEWLEREGRVAQADQLRLSLVSEDLREAYAHRLRALRDGPLEWHAFAGRDDFSGFELTVVSLEGAGEVQVTLSRLEDFHARWFPGSQLRLRWVERERHLSYEELEEAVMYGNQLWLCRRLRIRTPEEAQAVLVLIQGRTPWRATRGYGGCGLGVVEVEPGDRWTPAVIAHEFYHAAYGLQHTDGSKYAWDPFGIMGYPGASVALEMAYVDFRQRCQLASPPGVAQLLEEGWETERRARWHQADRVYREAYRRDPLHVWVAAALGRVALCSGRHQEAVEWLERAHCRDPSFELAGWRIRLLLDLGRGEEAEAVVRSTPGYDRSASAHLALGRARAEALDRQGSLFDFGRARGLEPASADPWFHLATIRHATGAYRSAERLYRRCLQRYPRWGAVIRRLAIVVAYQGRYEEARLQLRESRWLEGGCCEQAFAEATVQWVEGHWGEARRCYLRAYRHQRQAQPPLLALGYVSASLGQDAPACRWFQRCRGLNPVSWAGRIADLFLRRSTDPESARAEAQALLSRDPRNSYLLFLLLWSSKRKSSARRWAARLGQQEPNHPWLAAAKEFAYRT